jgi:lipoate-protein ligase A
VASQSLSILLDSHRRGEENMAIDEALLERGEPVVRLYGWRPAAVSLGRSQTEAAVRTEVARAFGIDVVQRSTGGGAILHNEDEVTYAVVVPVSYPGLPRDIPGSFAFLSEGVRRALVSLGIPAEVESAPGRASENLCYLRHQGTNLFVRGRKVSGGAQRRTPTAVLQHGTVIVERDEERMAELFDSSSGAIASKVTSLREEGLRIPRRALVDALARGFTEALNAPEARVVANPALSPVGASGA